MKSFFAALRSLVLPFGATSGPRIVLDGVNGRIQVYNAAGVLVGILDGITGFQFTGNEQTFHVLADGNVFVRGIPETGGFVQLASAAGFGGLMFLQPEDSSVPGVTFEPAALYAQTIESGGVNSQPKLQVDSPYINGAPDLARARFAMLGQTNTSPTNDSHIDLQAAMIQVQGNLDVTGIGHKEYVPYPGGITVTNSIVPFNIAGTTLTLEAGGVYSTWLWASYNGPVAADARWSWAKTDAAVGGNRHILALADSTADNTDSNMMAIRRGDATQQITGTPNGVANAFSVYQEFTIWTNGSANDEAVQLQFAQGVANATGCLLQSGYIILERLA